MGDDGKIQFVFNSMGVNSVAIADAKLEAFRNDIDVT
jgi:hypothetical protein